MRGPPIVPETANRKAERQEDSTLDAYYELWKKETQAGVLVQRAAKQVSNPFAKINFNRFCRLTITACRVFSNVDDGAPDIACLTLTIESRITRC